MPRWMTVTLRCWIAFIAFTNLGASFRCFTAYNFVHSKFFGIESEDNITNSMTGDSFYVKILIISVKILYIFNDLLLIPIVLCNNEFV